MDAIRDRDHPMRRKRPYLGVSRFRGERDMYRLARSDVNRLANYAMSDLPRDHGVEVKRVAEGFWQTPYAQGSREGVSRKNPPPLGVGGSRQAFDPICEGCFSVVPRRQRVSAADVLANQAGATFLPEVWTRQDLRRTASARHVAHGKAHPIDLTIATSPLWLSVVQPLTSSIAW